MIIVFLMFVFPSFFSMNPDSYQIVSNLTKKAFWTFNVFKKKKTFVKCINTIIPLLYQIKLLQRNKYLNL